MIDELRKKWNENAFEGLKEFVKIVEIEEDEDSINEVCKFVADQIRKASLWKRHVLYLELRKCSLVCRAYLSSQFRSVRDLAFPRYDIFYGQEGPNPKSLIVPPNRQFIQAYGKNRWFNLGVLSDGSSIEMPRIVNVPPCQKIKMSNVHSIFLTTSGKVYGCGRAANILIGNQKRTEKTTKGYIIEPTLIEIPDEEEILEIATTETCSILVSSQFMYVIGECAQFENENHDKKFRSSNCRRYKTENEVLGREAKVMINKTNVEVIFDFSSNVTSEMRKKVFGEVVPDPRPSSARALAKSFERHGAHENLTEVVLTHNGESITMCLFLRVGGLCYSLERYGFPSCPCDIVMNGSMIGHVNNYIVKFSASRDGNVFILNYNSVMARGKAAIWREKTAGWETTNQDTVENRMANCRVVIVFEEIPGSYGVENFCTSPDSENVIVQFGYLSGRQMCPDVNLSDDRIQSSVKDGILDTISNRIRERGEFSITREMMEKRTKNVFGYLEDLDEAFLDMEDRKAYGEFIAISHYLEYLLKITEESAQYTRDTRFQDATANRPPVLESLRTQGFINDIDKEDMINCLSYFERKETRSTDGVEKQKETEIIVIFYFWLEQFEKFLNNIEQGNRSYEEKKYLLKTFSNVQVENVHKIHQTRTKEEDLAEDEVPMNLKVALKIQDREILFDDVLKNRELFELQYPFLTDFIVEDRLVLNSLAFNYLFSRFDTFYVTENSWVNDRNIELKGTKTEVVGRGRGLKTCRVLAENPISEFVKPGTPNSDIWNLETKDGKIVPVHKYLMLLHSRQLTAMNRFNESFYPPNSFNNDIQEAHEPEVVKLKVEETEKVVREAIAALLDITTLYDKKMIELIDIMIFFDYQLMKEATSDVLDIIFQIANDTNIGYLYELFDHYEDLMLSRFLVNSHLVLMSNSACLPPLRLIKKMDESGLFVFNSSSSYQRYLKFRDRMGVYETEDIIRNFVDLNNDHEDEIWKILKEETKMEVRESAIYEEKAKMSRNSRIRKNSCNTGSEKAVSRPVNIHEKRAKSTSESFENHSADAKSPPISSLKTKSNVVSSPIAIEKNSSYLSPVQSPASITGNTPSHSFNDDFPDSSNSLSTPLSKKKSPKFVMPKGKKLKNADEMLKTPSPVNPWNRNRTDSSNFETVPEEFCMPSTSSEIRMNFREVVEEEKKLEKKRRGQDKTMVSLVHLEMEEQAEEQIKQVFKQDNEHEALVTVELVEKENDEKDQPIWGIMPGILKR